MRTSPAKFRAGHVVATPGFLEKCDMDYAKTCLLRHLSGDWGMVCKADWASNNIDLIEGGRLLSVYPLPNDPERFWIITEADRSATTFLLPEEY